MAENKRYYWLKFKEDFFTSKRIKKLRKLGADYIIIYLKMQLKALKNDGYLEITGLEDNIADEIALDIDEDTDKVQLTLSYLQACGLVEVQGDSLLLPYVQELTGSETASTQRSRNFRLKQKEQKVLQCNTSATQVQQPCNVEIEKEIEKDIDIDKKENKKKKVTNKFVPPTTQQVKEYCQERANGIDAEYFVDYYEARNWELAKGRKVKDWKACVRTWEKRNFDNRGAKPCIEINPKQREGMVDVVNWNM